MPEIRGTSAAGGAPLGESRGPDGPGKPAGLPPDQETSFKAHLDAKLAARRARKSVPSGHLDELIRLFNRRGEAFESARLVTKYPPIEKDDALYEVKTDTGSRRVIRARDGSYTIFD